VNRRAWELCSSGAGAEEVQGIWFFLYRLVPGALSGMPGSEVLRSYGYGIAEEF